MLVLDVEHLLQPADFRSHTTITKVTKGPQKLIVES